MSFFDIFRVSKIKKENQILAQRVVDMEQENKNLAQKLSELDASITPEMRDIFESKRMLAELSEQKQQLQNSVDQINSDLENKNSEIKQQQQTIEEQQQQLSDSDNKLENNKKKIKAVAYCIKSIQSYYEKFELTNPLENEISQIEKYVSDIECGDMLNPTAELTLHNSSIKDLKKQFKAIDNSIERVLSEYEKRYTTKANLAIYRLMVIALRAELQNVMYVLKYQKLNESLDQVHEISDKYLKIAADGNQQIAPTISKFISTIEVLFSDAVKVEYEYYVRKEQEKEQQRAIKEQMKQEAEERKLLEQQQKQVEKEESKYLAEIEKLKAQLAEASEEKSEYITSRIEEVNSLLSEVETKKEEISKLQNGKAGYVYIISNLGSFGDNVFKIGMTRRLVPQERIDELGSASVPFKFDVHSFIFSEDAPTLENKLHQILNDKRTNKINLRKEFFTVSLDELENLVYSIEPSAEFNRTMLAEEYRQSLSFTGTLGDFEPEDDDEDDADQE
ncbi:MAG: GIY-YIG nuclease family protein [Eubacteriales bacterium]